MLRLTPLLLGLLIVVVCAWTLITLDPDPGVTRANFRRLHAGMKLPEIEAILGRPADHCFYTTLCMNYWWWSDEGIVSIAHSIDRSGYFEANGKIRLRLAPAPESFYAKLRYWLCRTKVDEFFEIDPAALEFDTDIQFTVEPKSRVSVPRVAR